MPSPGDEMLAVISARERMTWRAYREAFDLLHLRAVASHAGLPDDIAPLRMRSRRLLSELAHAEIPPYESSTAIAAAPTVLAALPQRGLPRAVLCGARDLNTVSRLRSVCNGFASAANVASSQHPYSGGYAPSALVVEADDTGTLNRVADEAGIQFAPYPPAWRILDGVASLTSYEETLDWTSDPDPEWVRRDFDPDRLVFRREQNTADIRLSEYQDPVSRRQVHRLWRGTSGVLVDRYWGRWLMLKDHGLSIVLFDQQAQLLAIPRTVPLPAVHARALTLFSGLAPSRRAHPDGGSSDLDVYASIPKEAAETLASKLEQHLIFTDVGNSENDA